MTHKSIPHICPIRRIGQGEQHHFFGYYNKSPWNNSSRYLLAQRVPMMTVDLTGEETAEVGYFDLEHGDRFRSIGTTQAWNWQMGSQLQWLGDDSQDKVIFNTRTAQTDHNVSVYPDFTSTIVNITSGESRTLPLPVYVVSPNGRFALCVDYARFQITHPTIGYAATDVQPKLENAPSNDGIYRMDIVSGDFELILSLKDIRNFQPLDSMKRAIHWVTHLEIDPSSSRFLFIHRWTERVEDETCFLHRLFTANSDGTDLTLLECTDHPLPQLESDWDATAVGTFDYEKSDYQISHPAWKNDHQIVVWSPHNGKIHYHLYHDKTSKVDIIGAGLLEENGHMTYSRDGKWLLSDTYPDDLTNERVLFLYNIEKEIRYNIGSFYTDPNLGKPNRCDLHPRWSPSGSEICIDSVHESERQMYLLNVEALISNLG